MLELVLSFPYQYKINSKINKCITAFGCVGNDARILMNSHRIGFPTKSHTNKLVRAVVDCSCRLAVLSLSCSTYRLLYLA